MKLQVDATLCTGHGRCYSLAPELHRADEEGYNTERGGEIEVPPELEQLAKRSVATCPEQALSLT